MRISRIKLVVGLIAVFTIGFIWVWEALSDPQYFALRHKSEKWYVDFTAACDSVIASHPVGTNGSADFSELPVTDPSLPKMIMDLHPVKIQVSHRRLWMMIVANTRPGFGLIWEPKFGETNEWLLYTTAENLDTPLYSATRLASPSTAAPLIQWPNSNLR